MSDWRRYLYYRTECVRTTWTLRIGVVLLIGAIGISTRSVWVGLIGRSLVCQHDTTPSDAILIENFDPDYLLFERAGALERAGFAPRIFVPVPVIPERPVVNLVSKGIAEVMARQARIQAWDVIPIEELEPISLNAAVQIRAHLARERVGSLIVVAPGFRSHRSALVYGAVLGGGGMHVRCEPVIARVAPEHWTTTWHGVQTVVQELVKLQYYRLYVIPFLVSGR